MHERIDRENYQAFLQEAGNNPVLINTSNSNGETPLLLGCKTYTEDGAIPPRVGLPEDLEFVHELLRRGADPGIADKNGKAPLHIAAVSNNFELAKLLLRHGAPLSGKLMGAEGGSPLALALFYAKQEMGRFLARPAVPDNLRTAAALDFSLDMYFSGSDLTPEATQGLDFYRPFDGFPTWVRRYTRQEILDEALTWASRNNSMRAMQELVDKGANINANPYRGTPLLWAIYGDHGDAATWLITQGAKVNLKHDFGGSAHGTGATALHLAAQHGCLETLKILLAQGADPTIRDDGFNATPLGWAQHSGAKEAIEILSDV